MTRKEPLRGIAVGIGAPAVLLGACMGDGECPVYDYEPDVVRVSFRDAETGEVLCDKPNAAKPGKLVPVDEAACAYYLAGWYHPAR